MLLICGVLSRIFRERWSAANSRRKSSLISSNSRPTTNRIFWSKRENSLKNSNRKRANNSRSSKASWRSSQVGEKQSCLQKEIFFFNFAFVLPARLKSKHSALTESVSEKEKIAALLETAKKDLSVVVGERDAALNGKAIAEASLEEASKNLDLEKSAVVATRAELEKTRQEAEEKQKALEQNIVDLGLERWKSEKGFFFFFFFFLKICAEKLRKRRAFSWSEICRHSFRSCRVSPPLRQQQGTTRDPFSTFDVHIWKILFVSLIKRVFVRAFGVCSFDSKQQTPEWFSFNQTANWILKNVLFWFWVWKILVVSSMMEGIGHLMFAHSTANSKRPMLFFNQTANRICGANFFFFLFFFLFFFALKRFSFVLLG